MRETRFHCANGLVLLRICAPSEGAFSHCCRKCALLAAMLLFHSCFFAHNINQGLANLLNGSHLQKIKNTSESQNQLLCQYKNGKECKFYITWCTVIVSMKFLFDFRVPENLDSMLLKPCELILPSVRFSGLHDGLILRTSLQRKKFTAICFTLHRNELHTGILNSGYLPSGTCRENLNVFLPRFSCISVSFISTADKFVTNG